jgi:hypothetical protein
MAAIHIDVEEAANHAHIECLPEAPGPGDEADFCPRIKKIPYHEGLIGIPIASTNHFIKEFYSDGEFFRAISSIHTMKYNRISEIPQGSFIIAGQNHLRIFSRGGAELSLDNS